MLRVLLLNGNLTCVCTRSFYSLYLVFLLALWYSAGKNVSVRGLKCLIPGVIIVHLERLKKRGLINLVYLRDILLVFEY